MKIKKTSTEKLARRMERMAESVEITPDMTIKIRVGSAVVLSVPNPPFGFGDPRRQHSLWSALNRRLSEERWSFDFRPDGTEILTRRSNDLFLAFNQSVDARIKAALDADESVATDDVRAWLIEISEPLNVEEK